MKPTLIDEIRRLEPYGPRERRWKKIILRLETDFFQADIKIKSCLNTKQRRLIALTIYRNLDVTLNKIFSAYLKNEGMSWMASLRSDIRTLDTQTGLKLEGEKNIRGLRIRLRRLQLEMTQMDLAHLCRTSRSHISDIEHGKVSPHARTLGKLERVLQIPMAPPLPPFVPEDIASNQGRFSHTKTDAA